jgi:hypothetical protein
MNYSYDTVSEASSIGGHTSVAPGYDMNNYPYHSPKDEGLPTTMDNYSFNSYTATAPPHPDETTGSSSMYSYASSISGNSQYMGQPQQRLPPPNPAVYSPYAPPPQPSHQHHQHQHPHQQGLAPLLTHPRPLAYRTDYASMPPIPSMSHGQHNPDASSVLDGRRLPPAAAANDHSRTPRTQASSVGDVDMFHSNVTTNGTSPAGIDNGSPKLMNALTTDFEKEIVHEGDGVVLNHKAPEEDRWLYDAHKKYTPQKGKGMWDVISQKHSEVFPDKDHTTARLQMKVTRGSRKYACYSRYDVSFGRCRPLRLPFWDK